VGFYLSAVRIWCFYAPLRITVYVGLGWYSGLSWGFVLPWWLGCSGAPISEFQDNWIVCESSRRRRSYVLF